MYFLNADKIILYWAYVELANLGKQAVVNKFILICLSLHPLSWNTKFRIYNPRRHDPFCMVPLPPALRSLSLLVPTLPLPPLIPISTAYLNMSVGCQH